MNDKAKAKLMIAEIDRALMSGTKHFSIDGRELKTTVEIIKAIAADGRVTFRRDVEPEKN